MIIKCGSNSNAVHINDAGEELALPFDSDGAVHFLVPVAKPCHIHTIASYSQDDAVDDILEVVVCGRELADDLS